MPVDLPAARAWLFGVAHKTLQSSRRREGRQDALAVRSAETAPGAADPGGAAEAVARRVDLAAAWPRLSLVHQEAIALPCSTG